MSGGQYTLEGAVQSLTGWEELSIARHFDQDFAQLMESHPMRAQRAVVFALLTREGIAPRNAYAQTMGMSLAETNDYFAVEEVVKDDPTSDVGKGSRRTEQHPPPWPDGVS